MTGERSIDSIPRRVQRFLTSPRTAAWLLGAWVTLLVVWVLPFTLAGQKEDTVGAIALDWLPLRVLYWAIAIVTLMCTAARVMRDLRRCSRRGVPRRASTLGRDETIFVGLGLDDFAERLSSNGFDVERNGEALSAVRGRLRPLWGSLLHFALLLLVIALIVNGTTKKEAGIELIEGQSAAEFFANTTPRPATLSFKDALGDFRLKTVSPRFYQRYLLFMQLEAVAQWRGESRHFSLAEPLWLSPTSYVSIQDFNYAPKITVKSSSGKVIDDTVSSLKLFPPGSSDAVDVVPAKIRIQLRVFSDHRTVGGRDVSWSYNLNRPRVYVTVFERVAGVPEERILARRLVGLGEPITLPDGTTVTVSHIYNVGTFRLASAPWMPAVALSGLLVLLGAAGRLLMPREDVVARSVEGGVLFDARRDTLGRGRSTTDRIVAMVGERA